MQRHSTWIEVIDILESSTSSLQNQVMLARIHQDAHFIQVDWSIVPPGMFVTWSLGADDNFALIQFFFWHLNNLDKVLDIWIDLVNLRAPQCSHLTSIFPMVSTVSSRRRTSNVPWRIFVDCSWLFLLHPSQHWLCSSVGAPVGSHWHVQLLSVVHWLDFSAYAALESQQLSQ